MSLKYKLFLFDLDDTLLDFRASEKLSFQRSLASFSFPMSEDLFHSYQLENRKLWKLFEEGKTTKEDLKVDRFRRTFALHGIDLDPEKVSSRYLEALPETVVLMDHAEEILRWLRPFGEIGIVTNGIHATQTLRIKNSPLKDYISFMCVSEDCGFAKPDERFFEHTSRLARNFRKEDTLIIGDRWEADIVGAHRFGVDSVWFNPDKTPRPGETAPTYEIAHLSELRAILT